MQDQKGCKTCLVGNDMIHIWYIAFVIKGSRVTIHLRSAEPFMYSRQRAFVHCLCRERCLEAADLTLGGQGKTEVTTVKVLGRGVTEKIR